MTANSISEQVSGLLSRRFAENFFPIPPTSPLSIGSVAPPFELQNVTTGQIVRLADFLKRDAAQVSSVLDQPPRSNRALLVAFTRIFTEKHYCPLCFPHLIALNKAYSGFRQRDVEVLLIASLDLAQSQTVQQDLQLQMPLLCDPTCRVFRRYQLGQALGAPLPAQFLLDQTGRIRFRHLFSFIEPNASIERLLSILDSNPYLAGF